MGTADLHIHTTASDGLLTPCQVVEKAKEIGLDAIAITDHDSVSGISEAIECGDKHGLEVVPGVELSAEFGARELHILGYFVDWTSSKLNKHLEKMREARVDRVRKMVEKLRVLNVEVELDRVLEIAGTGSVGRPHVARAICEVGAAPDIVAAFSRYLNRGAPAYVERFKISPIETVTLIVNCGGVACLAHPGGIGKDEIISTLIKAGLRAIEVYHPDHSPSVSEKYLSIASRFGLIVTGGSDSHGTGLNGSMPIGSFTVDTDCVEKLRAASTLSYSK
jgi:predicted metal-dependent phosphoesterase TrpH